VEVFQLPLKQSKILSADQIHRIFSNVESLHNFNVLLLQDLENIVNNWNDDSLLGEVFIKMADFLKLYIIYINNYTHGLEVLNNSKTNPQFSALIEAGEQNPRCSFLDLPALLIMPVQRIPRYILLLTEIYKNTPPNHPDHEKLGISVAKVKEVAADINEANRHAEAHLRVYNLSKLIDHLSEPLIKPSRHLILEGELRQKPKAASLSDSWDIMYYFLFNDVIVQTKKKGKRFSAKSLTPLSSLQVIRYEEKHEFGMFIQNTFLVVSSATNNNEETTKWINTIIDTQKAYAETVKSHEGKH